MTPMHLRVTGVRERAESRGACASVHRRSNCSMIALHKRMPNRKACGESFIWPWARLSALQRRQARRSWGCCLGSAAWSMLVPSPRGQG